MNDDASSISAELPQQPARKPWTTPVVSFLSMDQTENGPGGGNDGNGSTGAS
ncbi:hypothetical protein [Paracidovorax avenae]|uniref:hypothetical protein n=1 Tax=Paracidovorax avenae TaxID=80867 RepID=UPI0018640286|nr:hypothetical protein [Paracidovorax avenae]